MEVITVLLSLPSSHWQAPDQPGCRQPCADRRLMSSTVRQDSTVLRPSRFCDPDPKPPTFQNPLVDDYFAVMPAVDVSGWRLDRRVGVWIDAEKHPQR